MEYKISVLSHTGTTKAEISNPFQAILAWEGNYEEGDTILINVPTGNQFYMIRIDDCLEEELVYLTQPALVYTIPFNEKKTAHNPKAFTGERHYLTLRTAKSHEISSYRNLAKNILDQHGDQGCFPHATANVETRGEAVFAARNAVDGVVANRDHGEWPYESWGINQQENAELTLEFGRPVDFDEIVLYTRADFPHDNWWEQVTFTFSDGSTETVMLEKSYEPHVIPITRKSITWLKFGQLIKAADPSPFPALTQIEVYGTEA